MPIPKKILHIDFDSFFASCEQQFNPKLRNRPIGVTAANGRTCIIAASVQAKKFGIKTGTRSYEAQRLCPEIIFVKADFNKYLEVSKKFLKICKDYSPFTEIFSIDEVFMDVTLTEHLFGDVYRIVDIIKKRVKEEIGEFMTVSIGLSHNKLLAKMASSLKKPNGFMEIKPEDIENIYKNAKLTDVCGIGERIKTRLNSMGIFNLLQLRMTPFYLLISEFGKAEANFLKGVGLALDLTPVIPYTEVPEVKSVGRNYCLPKNEYNEIIVLQNIFELCEEIGIKLRKLDKKAKTIGLSLRGSKENHARTTIGTYTNSGKDIFRACKDFYEEWRKEGQYVRMISIWAENLEDTKNISLSLFDSLNKKDNLLKAVDIINNKFGDYTVRNGFLLYADKLKTMPNGYLADKWERVKIAQI